MSGTAKEDFERIIDLSKIALSVAIVINGSAAIALLAFIGGIWSDDISTCAVIFFAIGIGTFAFGVLLPAIAFRGTFIAELFRFVNNDELSAKNQRWAVRSGKFSLVLFFIGTCASITAIVFLLL